MCVCLLAFLRLPVCLCSAITLSHDWLASFAIARSTPAATTTTTVDSRPTAIDFPRGYPPHSRGLLQLFFFFHSPFAPRGKSFSPWCAAGGFRFFSRGSFVALASCGRPTDRLTTARDDDDDGRMLTFSRRHAEDQLVATCLSAALRTGSANANDTPRLVRLGFRGMM